VTTTHSCHAELNEFFLRVEPSQERSTSLWTAHAPVLSAAAASKARAVPPHKTSDTFRREIRSPSPPGVNVAPAAAGKTTFAWQTPPTLCTPFKLANPFIIKDNKTTRRACYFSSFHLSNLLSHHKTFHHNDRIQDKVFILLYWVFCFCAALVEPRGRVRVVNGVHGGWE
jgi:hypothetical protein